MKLEVIKRFDITDKLNDYSNSFAMHLYRSDKNVYYFFIHDIPDKKDFSFMTDQKLIVLLYSKGLISFKMTNSNNKWQPEPEVIKTVSKDIIKLIVQELY